jgi:DNA-binding LacI/PurR family transcriptional regulator
MKRNSAPAVDTAQRYIEEQISRGAWRRGDRIPTIVALAALAGVSKASMEKAIIRLKKQKSIHARPGAGIVIGEEEKSGRKHELPAVSPRLKWERVYTQLKSEILSGVFHTNKSLPPSKQLQQQFGISFHTLRKALQRLEDEGYLAHRGTTYSIVTPSRPRSGNTIMVIVSELRVPQVKEYIRAMEKECTSRGIAIELLYIPYRVDSSILKRLNRSVDTVLGYAVWGSRLGELEELIHNLVATNKPVSILDISSDSWLVPIARQTNRRLRVIRLATRRCGEAVVRYLLKLGHRQIAYISPFHSEEWSVQRYENIKRELLSTDASCRLSPFTVEGFTTYFSVIGKFWRYRNAVLDGEVPQVSDRDRALVPQFDRVVALIRFLKKEGADPQHIEELQFNFFQLLYDRFIKQQLEPVLSDALKERSITAWIGANDTIALQALNYLQERGIEIPERLSVVGFDNVPDAGRVHLTSFDFNIEGAVTHSVNHILYSNWVDDVHRNVIIETDGYIRACPILGIFHHII